MKVEEIPLSRITLPTELHRMTLDPLGITRLANSIRDVGLMQPITVEAQGDHYVLRAGHRRLEAHRALGRDTISAIVRPADSLATGEVLTWTENLEREDISPIEQARALERMRSKGGLTIAAIGRTLKRSDDWVETRLELLRMPPELVEHVHAGTLPISHALTLARVTDDNHRNHLTTYALTSGASHAVLKDWVAQWLLDLEAGRLATAALPPLPVEGQSYTVTVPCITCAKPHPAVELRIVRICTGCVHQVLEATEDWRSSARGDDTTDAPRT